MDRKILHGKASRDALIAGARKLHDAVASTLGPKGRNVVIEQMKGLPRVTKDGVSVARTIFLRDEFENMGAQLLKQASIKTGEKAGDGTTTSTVIAMKLLEEGERLVRKGWDPMQVSREWEKGLFTLLNRIEKVPHDKVDDETLVRICSVAANDQEEIGRGIAEVLINVGVEGIVNIEPAASGKTEITDVQGTEIESGYLSPYFSTNPETLEAVFGDVTVIVTDNHLWHINSVKGLLEFMGKEKKPFIIFAPIIEKDALGVMVVNSVRGGLLCAAVSPPGIGTAQNEFLEDIALITGATVITKSTGLDLEHFSEGMFGHCGKARVDQRKTLLIGGGGDRKEVAQKINFLEEEIKNAKDPITRGYFEGRISRLMGRVTGVSVGAFTEVEAKEKIDLYDDALCAGRAALKEGIVPGGGTAYNILASLPYLPPSMQKALREPMRKIFENSGLSRRKYKEALSPLGDGVVFDPKAGTYREWKELPDPLTVVKTAITNAVSVASTLLTTNCAIGFDEVSGRTKREFEDI